MFTDPCRLPKSQCALLPGFFLALVAFCVPFSLNAQNSASIRGSVLDPAGLVVKGASIELLNSQTAEKQTTKSDERGNYSFSSVPPSSYTLSAEAQGFSRVAQSATSVQTDQKITIDFHLQIGAASQTVTVEGSAIQVNGTDATVGTVIGLDLIQNLPLNGRSLQSILSLVPGVVPTGGGTFGGGGTFSVSGQRSQSNIFTIDGVSANISAGTATFQNAAGGLPALNAVGGTQSLVNIDDLQEFRVNTSTFSAEYGTSPGGQFILTTRSGGNRFHGSAHEFFRNEAMNANDWFNNSRNLPQGELRQNQFGGSVGGPVIIPGRYNGKNRTFFFASYEQLRLMTPVSQELSDPNPAYRNSVAAWLKPIVNQLPLPNGPVLDQYFSVYNQNVSFPNFVQSGALRVDQVIGKKGRAFVRYNNSPSQGFQPQEAWYNEFDDINTKTLTAGFTWTLSPTTVNDVHFNWSALHSITSLTPFVDFDFFSYLGRTPGPNDNWASTLVLYPDPDGDATTVTFEQGRSENIQKQMQFTDSFSWQMGSHTLKAGMDIRRLTPTLNSHTYDARAFFQTFPSAFSGSPTSLQIASNIQATPTVMNYGAYIQDTWKASRRLTVSAGLRWEADPVPGSVGGVLPYTVRGYPDLRNLSINPPGTPLYNSPMMNFAPRLGLAYSVSRAPGRETVLRLGGGIFYDSNNNTALAAYGAQPFGMTASYSNPTYPFSSTVLTPPNSIQPQVPPFRCCYYAFDSTLKLPVTYSWSAALERALGRNSSFSATYVGNGARKLLQQVGYTSAKSAFANGIPYTYIGNGPTSSYNALQLQFRSRPYRGAEIFTAYTWSHAIDDAAIDQSGAVNINRFKGSSAADLRHVFRAGISYQLPQRKFGLPLAGTLLNGWGTDLNIAIQSGYPFSLTGRTIVDPTGLTRVLPPNYIGGQQWIEDPHAPGGWKLNRAAFALAPAGVLGNMGRNILRGFPVGQADVAVRRTFRLTEGLDLQLRAEAFNVTNHPNFHSFNASVGGALFGISQNTLASAIGGFRTSSPNVYQIGGPRSLQLAVKIMF